jgi:hypothetical protein
MSGWSFRRPSAPLVISCAALFMALSGTAVALQGKNTIDSGDIKPGAVHQSDIAQGAVGALTLARHAVVTGDIDDNAVTADKMDVQSVGGSSLQGGAVTASKLGPIQIVSNAILVTSDNRAVSVDCPSGTRLISGGADTAGPISLTRTEPATDDGVGGTNTQTWVAAATDPGASAASMRVYALCLQ